MQIEFTDTHVDEAALQALLEETAADLDIDITVEPVAPEGPVHESVFDPTIVTTAFTVLLSAGAAAGAAGQLMTLYDRIKDKIAAEGQADEVSHYGHDAGYL